MAKHLVTCKYCKRKFDANLEPFLVFDAGKAKRYAHQHCPEGSEEEIKRETDRDTLAKYIMQEYGKEIYDDPKIWVQIERFYKQNLTPIGIYNCLYYMSNILHKPIQKGNLGLIPYYYKEAEDYFKKIQKVQKTNEEKVSEINTFYNDIEVTIKSPQRKKQPKQLFAFLDEEE